MQPGRAFWGVKKPSDLKNYIKSGHCDNTSVVLYLSLIHILTVAALAIAVMVGDGCCAYVSINLGKKDVKTAKKSVGNAVVRCV